MYTKNQLLSDVSAGKKVRIRFYVLPGRGGYARCYNIDTKETVRWDTYKSIMGMATETIPEPNGSVSVYN